MQKLQYLTLSRKRYEIEHKFHEREGAAEVFHCLATVFINSLFSCYVLPSTC